MADESATHDLVELTRQAFDAANRGELAAAISYFALDAIWDASRNGTGTFEGAATIRGRWEDWRGATYMSAVGKRSTPVISMRGSASIAETHSGIRLRWG